MPGMEVTLPGGWLKDGRLERRARFRPLTGKTELALSELERDTSSLAYVNAVLLLVLERIGRHEVDPECVNALCMADRQFLMLRLAALLGGEQAWFKASCGRCRAPFDVELRRCDLPVKEAGPGFPGGRIEISMGEVELQVPTARTQTEILELTDRQALGHLLKCCIRRVNGAAPEDRLIDALSPEDVAAIDQALDDLAPAVCTELLVTCPECGAEQRAALNHYQLAGLGTGAVYHDIHTLAMHYHWGEEEILNMPRTRRHKYLDLIDRTKTTSGQVQ